MPVYEITNYNEDYFIGEIRGLDSQDAFIKLCQKRGASEEEAKEYLRVFENKLIFRIIKE